MKLKKVSPKQKGLAKLPKHVRNKMGYMEKGGKYDARKEAMKRGLEAEIKKAKGTPEAKALVDKYRKLTGVS